MVVNDEYGTQTTTHQPLYHNIRAFKQDGNMYRQVVNDTIYTAQTQYFTIRNQYQLQVGDIVVYNDVQYRIDAIKELTDDRANELSCQIIND